MKLTLGEKLKDLRIERKLTSKQVCDEIKKQYGYSLSVGKYNEMESDIDKDFGYRAFIYLSKFYEVSTDYLLGITETPSLDKNIQNACNVTGLSEEAIKKIAQLKTKIDFPANYVKGFKITGIEIMNSLILDKWFEALIQRLALYYIRTRDIVYIIENSIDFNIVNLDQEKSFAKLALFEVGQAANLIAENFKSPHFYEAAEKIEKLKTKFEKEVAANAQHNPKKE